MALLGAVTTTDTTSVAFTPMFDRYCAWHPLIPRSCESDRRMSSGVRLHCLTFDAGPETSAIIRLRMDMKIFLFACGMSVAGKCSPLNASRACCDVLSATTSPWSSSWKRYSITRSYPSSARSSSVTD